MGLVIFLKRRGNCNRNPRFGNTRSCGKCFGI